MKKRLKEIFERAETWPEEVQDEAVETLLSIEQGYVGDYELTAADRAALARSAEDVEARRFVPDAQVAQFFERNRRA
jgi:hypothetical protein